MATVISSAITAAVTLVVCLITNYSQAQKTTALIEYKLDELTKQVAKHNSLVERTYKLEQDSALHDAELKRQNERLKVLEHEGDKK